MNSVKILKKIEAVYYICLIVITVLLLAPIMIGIACFGCFNGLAMDVMVFLQDLNESINLINIWIVCWSLYAFIFAGFLFVFLKNMRNKDEGISLWELIFRITLLFIIIYFFINLKQLI